jgi:hypothetical protein
VNASRPFIDSFGYSWQAWEVGREDSPRTDGALGGHEVGGRLYFFCRGTTRVLKDFPADWQRATWAELEDLCARAAILGADGGARATVAEADGALGQTPAPIG